MSTTETGLPPNVDVYLAALRAELADLAPEERDDLLSEVEPSLLEAAAEGDEPSAARLGSPADFAADLRASAGQPPAPRARAARTGLRGSLSRLLRRSVPMLRELAPAWWAARAYIAVGLLALTIDVDWSARHPFLPRFGSGAATALMLALVLAGSFALGLRIRRAGPRARRAALALDLALLVAAVPVIDRAADTPVVVPSGFVITQSEAPAGGLVFEGAAVENIYAYDRAGRLLHDVRLYDNFGRPLALMPGAGDPNRRQIVERGGARAFNAFPIRYYEPGTRRVARPDAAPNIEPKPLKTRPLARRHKSRG